LVTSSPSIYTFICYYWTIDVEYVMPLLPLLPLLEKVAQKLLLEKVAQKLN
jgi:hypothetical protein